MSIGTLTWADSEYEVALDKLKKEIDRGPITESEVEMSSRLGIPPRALTDEDWHALSQPQTGQSVEPDYGPQGLKQVSPAAELFGLGLGKIAVNAASKTKMYSDQVVDRFTRMTTPKTTYHGGESNIGTLRTTYDRAMQGQKVDNTVLHKIFGDEGAEQAAKELDRYGYSPFQSALYTAPKDYANKYAQTKNTSVYEMDISPIKKIFNSNKPSKFMKGELNKEIKLAEKAGEGRRAAELKGLRDGEKYMSHFTEAQREFLERYGYEAVRTLEQTGKGADKTATLIFRPEKFAFKESANPIANQAIPIPSKLERIGIFLK